MELFQPELAPAELKPAFTARYSAVLWQPLPGTGERIVALVAVQAHESTPQAIAPGTYQVLSAARLRRMLGSQRGNASDGILKQTAEYMTHRQRAGLPIEELRPLFRGFEVGPPMVGRAYSVQQLLDAAVRSISAFGSAEEMIEEEEQRHNPRHMVRTAEFLKQLRRIFVANAPDLGARFDVPLQVSQDVPQIRIDYAFGPLAVQVTSLPSTQRQADLTEREAQSKMFELDMARGGMGGNAFRPTLMFNTDALASDAGDEARKHALATRERLQRFAR